MASTTEARRPPQNKATVTIIHNGRVAQLDYQPNAAVRALLERAMHEFGITGNPEELALFNSAGAELDAHQGAEDAGIKPGDELVLRQRVVRGGH